ncbi:MAG: AAA-like domain-containing protein, partial [Ktedonobacteraceae bacterium]
MSNAVDPVFQAGGALLANSVVYMKREVETEVTNQLRRMNYLKFIEPRQQGKTSLINWLSGNLRTAGYSFAVVDVSTLDWSSEEAWYDSLYDRLRRQLDLLLDNNRIMLPKTSHTWRQFLADLAQCASQAERRVIIALDEIGTTHQTWAEPFFRVLRDVFNNRQNEPYFEQLAFILSGCYNPAGLIRQENESPFNVAVRIHLPDFTYSEACLLVAHLQLSEEQAVPLAKKIYSWTDGQPYLTQLLCYYLAVRTQALHQVDVDNAVQR